MEEREREYMSKWMCARSKDASAESKSTRMQPNPLKRQGSGDCKSGSKGVQGIQESSSATSMCKSTP